MADTMRLSYSGTDINFSPGMGYTDPEILDVKHHRSGDGTLRSHKFYHKRAWSVPVSWFGSTDRNNIVAWWRAVYDLTFHPDMVNAPGTSYTVRLTNRTSPLASRPGPYWEVYYFGTLEIEEV